MAPLSMVDPVFKVAMDARPSNYETTHISWARPASNLNWYRYVVVRNPNGYPTTPDDGEVIFPNPNSTGWNSPYTYSDIGFTDDIILRVSSILTGGAIDGFNIISTGSATTATATSLSPISTGNTKGKNFLVDINSGSITFGTSAGGDYTVGDFLRIPGNALKYPTSGSTETLPGVTSNTQLGVTNTYHLYDAGATGANATTPTYATTANPGVTAGTNPYAKKYNKYYYSLFAYVAPSNSSNTISPADIIALDATVNYSEFTWIKIGEASSVVVHQNTTRSTKDILLDHLPAFYSGKNNFNQNKDLSDFLSLFAFHLDVYLAETKAVFNMADAETNDEVLLKQLLKQFGSELTQISDLAQARKVLANIVRNYSLGGSTLGLKNLIESYTGNAVKQIQGLNLLPDYNTSSFVEGIGNWYPVASVSNSFDDAYPYDYTLEPMYAAVYGTTPTDSMVAQLCDASLMGTTNVNISPNASFVGKFAYLTSTSGTFIANKYETRVTVSAITPTTGTTSTTVKVDDTSKLKLGAIPLVVSGSGVFSPQTVITHIEKDGVTFKVNIAPSTQIAVGAIIAISNSITSGSLSIHPANLTGTNTGTVTFYSGSRRGVLSAAATVSTTDKQYLAAVAPNIVKVGDYVSGSQSIPANTKVIAIEADETNRYLLSNKLTGSIPTARILYFSSSPNRGLSAAVDMIPVSPSMPYSFGAHFNANNATTRSTVVSLTWHDIDGIDISTTSVTAVAPTNTVPFANTNFAKTWYPTIVTGTSPTNAAYVTPSFSIVDAYNNARYCVDSMMLTKPLNVIKKSRTSNVATLTTDVPHNFFYKTGLTPNTVAVVMPDDATFNTSSASLTGVVQDVYGNYTFSYANTGSDVTNTTTTGYAASFPMITETINGGIAPLTAFQDARETTLEVAADRVNLVSNPSFEYDTSPTLYDWSILNVSTTSVVTSGTVAFTGTKYATVTKGVTATAYAVGIIQSSGVTATAGKTYTASCYVKYVSGTAQVKIGIRFYDSSGTLLSTKYGNVSPTLSGTSVWTRITSATTSAGVLVPVVAPANTVTAKVLIISNNTDTAGTLEYGIDGVLFEETNSALKYFDGDFDGYNYLSSRNSMWESTSGKSKSHLYNNKTINIDNIDALTVRGVNYA